VAFDRLDPFIGIVLGRADAVESHLVTTDLAETHQSENAVERFIWKLCAPPADAASQRVPARI
jgi:hypothetical protein